jgi:hypothetical protein
MTEQGKLLAPLDFRYADLGRRRSWPAETGSNLFANASW